MDKFELADLSQRKEDLLSKARLLFDSNNIPFTIPNENNGPVTLSFIGQYDAGKSTILKMLTGLDDIEIGAGVKTTETHRYNWHGIIAIDTPGIKTGLYKEHDDITNDAIAQSDMLVFVITNELFNDDVYAHFRKLAIDKGKGREMILVVNKMKNTTNCNSKEDQEVILEYLRESLKPLSPEQLYISFIDAEYYLESQKETNPAKKELKEQISGYQQFIDNLNRFIVSHKTAAKLTTSLYILDEKCSNVLREFSPKSNNPYIDALLSNLVEQRHEWITCKQRIQDAIKDIYSNGATQIRRLGTEAAESLCSGCKEQEVVEALEAKVREANEIFEKTQQKAIEEASNRLKDINETLNDIEALETTKELEAHLEGKFEGLPDYVKETLNKLIPGMKNVGQKLTQNAYNTATQSGLKLNNFSGSKVHEIIQEIGEFLKIDFKPWTPVKIARGVAIGGRILSILGVGLSIFMEYKSEYDENRIEMNLKQNRQNIKQQFNNAASSLLDIGNNFISVNINTPMNETIDDYFQRIKKIRDSAIANSNFCKQVDSIQQDCLKLIKTIQSLT